MDQSISRFFCRNPYLARVLRSDHIEPQSTRETNEIFDFCYDIKVQGYLHKLQHYPMRDVTFVDNKIQFAKLLDDTAVSMPKTYFAVDQIPAKTTKNFYLKYAFNNGGNQVHLYNSAQKIAEHIENDNRPFVIQEEVTDPLLLDNKKFVLRIWLVSIAGEYFVGRNGLFRIQLDNYDPADTENINAHNQYDMDKLGFGIFEEYAFYEKVMEKIISMMGPLTAAFDTKLRLKANCFQIFGVDLIIDREFQPHVIEVNSWPNMNAPSTEHQHLLSEFFHHFYFDLIKPCLSGSEMQGSDYFIYI